MKLSLSNSVFSNYPLKKNLVSVQKLGFKNLEFNMKSVEEGNEKAAYKAKKLLKLLELNCLTLHAATFPVTQANEIAKALYYQKISAWFADQLSASIMVIHSNVSRKLSPKDRKKIMSKIFKELNAYTKRLNLKLSLENLSHHSKSYGKNINEIEETLSALDNKTAGITLDFSHAETTGQTIELLNKYQNKISNVHISNKNHKPLTDNTPNLKEFLQKLKNTRYNGPLTIELDPGCNSRQIHKTAIKIRKNIQ